MQNAESQKIEKELTLDDVKSAAARIAGAVRRTPVLKLECLREPLQNHIEPWLKLELLQVTGSFKARGAISKLRCLSKEQVARGIVTASSGNHGMAVAYAALVAQVPSTIFLPTTVPPAKIEKLRRFSARIEQVGTVFDDSNDAALEFAEKNRITYIHPFDDPLVVAGQGTVALEFLADVPELDTLLVAIGGGGLIGGVAFAAKTLRPGIRVIGVEPEGAPTLQKSVQAGALVTLAEIKTLAGTLAPRRSAALNLALVQKYVDDIVLVSDEQMRAAARMMFFEAGIAAELSGAAAMAALHCGAYRARPGERIGVIVCGAGTDGILPAA
jgi:threonine dehydratase